MKTRLLGRSGLRVAPLALGTDNFVNPTPEHDCARILDMAVAAGVNLIDTSNSYAKGEAERVIGRWLATRGGRDRVLIATKVFYPQAGDTNINARGGSRAHVLQACEDSLRRLGVEHIDLYQTHRPDFATPLDETLRAFDDLIRQGKVRCIGSTTAPAWFLVDSLWTSARNGYASIISEQLPYNVLDRRAENESLPMARAHGLGVLTWSPLAMGMLAGRYTSAAAPPADSRSALRGGIYADRVTERGVSVGNAFAALARAHGHDPAQAAIAWVLHQPGVTAPILGPRTPDQLERALPAADLALSDAFLRACDDLVVAGANVANFFNSSGWLG
jgi:1-deoxyxylulose-5-phosphate synthase